MTFCVGGENTITRKRNYDLVSAFKCTKNYFPVINSSSLIVYTLKLSQIIDIRNFNTEENITEKTSFREVQTCNRSKFTGIVLLQARVANS